MSLVGTLRCRERHAVNEQLDEVEEQTKPFRTGNQQDFALSVHFGECVLAFRARSVCEALNSTILQQRSDEAFLSEPAPHRFRRVAVESESDCSELIAASGS